VIEIDTHDLDGVTIISATGRLDALASAQLDAALRQAADAGQVHVLVDLSEVAYISSSCLRALLLGARRARAEGGDVKLCGLSGRVRQVFELAGFDLVFELWDSQAEGVAAFSSTPGSPPAASDCV
jgi:anti-anti-sigma factor